MALVLTIKLSRYSCGIKTICQNSPRIFFFPVHSNNVVLDFVQMFSKINFKIYPKYTGVGVVWTSVSFYFLVPYLRYMISFLSLVWKRTVKKTFGTWSNDWCHRPTVLSIGNPKTWLLPPIPSTLSLQQVVSLSESYCVSPGGAYWRDRGGGNKWGRSPVKRRRESLVLNKSFNTLCIGLLVSLWVQLSRGWHYPT